MYPSQFPQPSGYTGALLSFVLKTVALLMAGTLLSTAQTVQTLSPESNGTPAAAGDLSMQITYDVDVVVGSGNVTVTDLGSNDVVATFDITNPAHATVSGNTVTFATFPAVGGSQYNVEAPAGFVVAASGGSPAPGFGFNPGDDIWLFEVVAADTTGPAITALSPQNGTGASVAPTLSVTYDENVSPTSGPWTIEVYDVTADMLLASFSETDTASVSTLGSQLSISLGADLAFNNEYRVTASAGVVMDAAGNFSAEIASGDWQFTTGGAFSSGQVVISQVYGGGGNSGATLTNDFVELYNLSDSVISLEGWSVQYASSAGVTWSVTELSGVIQPGGYYLVEQKAGTGGTQALPTPDAIGTIAMASTNGKVALSSSTTAFAGADPGSEAALSDLVGYGSANAYEGSGAAPSLGNTLAAIRKVNGSQDTNDNSADFLAGAPAPRNSATPPYVPGNDGSGVASASNGTAGAGTLFGSAILPSGTAGQTVRIALEGSSESAVLETIEIDVPADFGTLSESNIGLSGAAAGSGSATLSGQTITVSGVAVSTSDPLVVDIAGLTTPDATAEPSDAGNRTFTVRTATAGGTPTAVATAPSVRIAVAVADMATLRAVVLPSPKVYLIVNEVVVTYVESGNFRNQHYIQDPTAGILIDDQPVALGASFLRGDGLTNLVGGLTGFGGILQFNPVAATGNVVSSDNTVTPIDVTLAELTASPLTYQSRLVRAMGVTFQDSTGSFSNNSEHVLAQGLDTFGFRTFFNADYSGTEIPDTGLDIVGIVRTVSNTNFLSPRALSDITETMTGGDPVYADFAADFAGGQGPLLDFDGDGVPNGLEYLFGVDDLGFTPTPQIVNGEITWPIEPARTDAGYIVETSVNLEDWDPVLEEDLDLSNPNAVRFVVPAGDGPFFVRIGAVFAAEP
ncbi:MAG: lamin tail domain-containing protein [Luteolibacter sp.]